MRVLITGGGGFIGSHLCDALLNLGHSVDVLDSFITGQRSNLEQARRHDGFRLYDRDVCEPLPFRDYDWLVHAASPASPVDYLAHPLITMRANGEGTQQMLNFAKHHKARFLLFSTSEVYGDPDESPQTESYIGRVNTVSPRSVYNESKRYAEALTMMYHRQYGVDTRIVRVFNTYGPRMRHTDGRIISTFIDCAMTGRSFPIFGDGSQTRSMCYVDDLVRGVIALLSAEAEVASGIVMNMGMPREHTVLEIADYVATTMQVPWSVEFRTLPQDDPKRRCPDISLAERVLGWRPAIDLKEGLWRTMKAIKADGTYA